ncbi:ABC transporter substrate-binding protein [Adlercreutzia sp. ZJ473]|uniref:ABC transporter substrate-binding protein n=1 Tax=Adlercreutzia sp. ZJ473 TaxID=2722822 RepID=UPI0015524449|nr:ABC transporter substrate-binding protein [Adlercreutzia sp. ZJ473]
MKRPKHLKRAALIAAAACGTVLALALAGCGQAPQSSSAASGEGAGGTSPQAEKITFALDWTPNTNHTGLYVAAAKGYFAEQGLDVEVVQPPDGAAEPLVASGKAQFGVSFQDTLAPALVGDDAMPVTAVAAIVQHNTSGILSRAGEGMDRPRGLEGHKYATWEMPVEQATIAQVMKDDGGDFSKVELYPESVTDEVSALQSKQVDAIWVFRGWGGVACDVAGLDTDYFNFADIDPVFDYYTPVVIGNDEFLEQHPDVAKKFLAALKKGYEFAIDDPDAAADILMEQVPELAGSEDLIRASQRYLADQYRADAAAWGVIDSGRWSAFYQWLLDNQLIDAALDPTSGFTNEYL